jgi:positive regulator of sigma E activity
LRWPFSYGEKNACSACNTYNACNAAIDNRAGERKQVLIAICHGWSKLTLLCPVVCPIAILEKSKVLLTY